MNTEVRTRSRARAPQDIRPARRADLGPALGPAVGPAAGSRDAGRGSPRVPAAQPEDARAGRPERTRAGQPGAPRGGQRTAVLPQRRPAPGRTVPARRPAPARPGRPGRAVGPGHVASPGRVADPDRLADPGRRADPGRPAGSAPLVPGGLVGRALPAVRTPFVLLVLALLGGGLICLLVINTTLGTAQFQINHLRQDIVTQSQQEQALQEQVAGEQSLASIQKRALRLGMRQQPLLNFINVRTGRIYRQKSTEPGVTVVPGYIP